MKYIIGFSGKKKCGKDTAAKVLGESYTKLAFADSLKEASMKMFDLTYDQVYDEILKETIDKRYNKTPRQLLQWFGSVMRNQFDTDHFLNLMNAKIDRAMNNDGTAGNVVVTDVRYDNECLFLRARDNVDPSGSGTGTRVIVFKILRDIDNSDTHESENGISDHLADHIIINNGSIEELHKKILDIIEST
jgi:dephospho-CoA kinase